MTKATVNPKTRKTVAIDITRIKNACFAIKKDERFHKTEEAIFSALKELIEEHPTTLSIRPTDLAKRSKIAASTFYRHYETIDDAIKYHERNLERRFRFLLRTKMQENLDLRQSIQKIIYFIYQNRDYFATALCRGSHRAFNNLFLAIKPKICHACHLPKNSELIFMVCLGEIYVLVEKWYKDSFDLDKVPELTEDILYLLKTARNHLINLIK